MPIMLQSVLSSLLLAGAASAASLEPRAAPVSTTTCNGQTYTYEYMVGYGALPGNATDKFGDTLGGIGSSAAIDRSTWTRSRGVYTGILYALPDRGWNTEGTLNYNARVHRFNITYTPRPRASVANPAPPNIVLTYLNTVKFLGPQGGPTTGLDADADGYRNRTGFPPLPEATFTGDGFGGDGPGGQNIPVDSEGLVVNSDGSFWVSDEYAPYIYRFGPRGFMLNAISPPPAILPMRNGTISFSADSAPRYNPNITVTPSDPDSGRENNQGLEGLTASPDGKYLYALMQSALSQEGGSGSGTRQYSRLLQYDISDPANPVYTAEYVVPLPFYVRQGETKNRVAAQSEIHFISATQFLILARDSSAGQGQTITQSMYRHADVFDISNATNIMGDTYDCATCAIATTKGVLNSNITTATYCSFLDYNNNDQLNRFGVHNGGNQDSSLLNEKWESLALVPTLDATGDYFLFTLSDNDFITQDGHLKGGQFNYSDESRFNLNNQILGFRIKLPAGSTPL